MITLVCLILLMIIALAEGIYIFNLQLHSIGTLHIEKSVNEDGFEDEKYLLDFGMYSDTLDKHKQTLLKISVTQK